MIHILCGCRVGAKGFNNAALCSLYAVIYTIHFLKGESFVVFFSDEVNFMVVLPN